MFKSSKPKTELIWAAVGSSACSLMLLITLTGTVPLYRDAKKKAGGEVIIISAEGYDSLLAGYRYLFFLVCPSLAVAQGMCAWFVFKNSKNVSNSGLESISTEV